MVKPKKKLKELSKFSPDSTAQAISKVLQKLEFFQRLPHVIRMKMAPHLTPDLILKCTLSPQMKYRLVLDKKRSVPGKTYVYQEKNTGRVMLVVDCTPEFKVMNLNTGDAQSGDVSVHDVLIGD